MISPFGRGLAHGPVVIPAARADCTRPAPWGPYRFALCTSNHDLIPLARDCGYKGPPFPWDDARRFEIRASSTRPSSTSTCPSEPDDSRRKAEAETPEQLAALKRRFPAPRDAVAYILDQFSITRQKDERAHDRYRTKERIREIYEAMFIAQSHRPGPTKPHAAALDEARWMPFRLRGFPSTLFSSA